MPHYFDEKTVVELLKQYHKSGCTDPEIRNQIMSHAPELVSGIISGNKLFNLCDMVDDLHQVAWVAIESALYKFNFAGGHPKCFSLWSQIAYTSMLAAIKKTGQDYLNKEKYIRHTDHQVTADAHITRFLKEAREIFKYHEEYLLIIDSIEELYHADDDPSWGLIDKLSKLSGLCKLRIVKFLSVIELFDAQFTDSPFGKTQRANQLRIIDKRDRDKKEND